MTYIKRHLEDQLITQLSTQEAGIILSGVVGSGKTTLIRSVIEELRHQFTIFEFSGDDTLFRSAVSQDSKYLFDYISSRTQKKAILFIDEVQKSEVIFDAIKYAFDHLPLSFIVSGSNPHYLNTVAKKRLQRRAHFLKLFPFSLSEILLDKKIIKQNDHEFFKTVLKGEAIHQKLPKGLELSSEIQTLVANFLKYGGLPLAYLAEEKNNGKTIEIKKVVERGFESFSVAYENLDDSLRIELAKRNSREFSYQGIFQKTGIRKREIVNSAIDSLINHGYLLRKCPFFFESDRKSYLATFSYIDCGIVSYLTGEIESDEMGIGGKVESLVFSRLDALSEEVVLKAEIGYLKPYSVDINNKTKFKEGEIDFIFRIGKKIIPIEVKHTIDRKNIDTKLLEEIIRTHDLTYGVVCYQGMPFYDDKKKIFFIPFWAI